ncbi:LacI family DNA-binding transcriptional regulator [Cetobacterium sp. 8H]|uniref:substrate-binding domain-containing protein n=1 Tax=Cetobacterium sp. 8H TaxID=2759681 RepID=UPI00163B62B1|nr:LacI family DNA-binding transcriptional regulator [Cetobacterium sp. 8H]MBC2850251.1 LacI family DNA-binding transcriptional regulator [Cetobacterium sp. 8H]
MITQSELAKILGITRTTVARALNGSKNIKPETKERVLKLASELGYEKNYLGSSLAIKEKKVIIALIVKSINEEYSKQLKNGLRDFEEEVKAYGIKIKIIETDINEVDSQIETLNKILEKKIHGLIIIPLDKVRIKKILQPLKNEVSIVSVGKQLFEDALYIDSRYHKSGRIAAEVLGNISKPNKKILIIDGGDDRISSKDYLTGFYEKIIEFNREYIGPISIENLLENKEEVLKYLSDDIGSIYINRFAPEIIEYLKPLNKTKFKFVTNGFNQKIRGLIESGEVVATISEDFYNQGYTAGKRVFELLYKTNLKRPQEYKTKIDILFKESLD